MSALEVVPVATGGGRPVMVGMGKVEVGRGLLYIVTDGVGIVVMRADMVVVEVLQLDC